MGGVKSYSMGIKIEKVLQIDYAILDVVFLQIIAYCK